MPITTPVQPLRPLPGPPSAPIYAGSTDSGTPAVQGGSYATLPDLARFQPGSPGAGTGVSGTSGSGTGVSGDSQSGIGVQGTSSGSDAIKGTSTSSQHAGVAGVNTSGGSGVAAASDSNNGTGIYARGFTQAAHFQHTDSTSPLDAVLSETSSQGHAAVAAHNNGGGFAFWGASDIQGGIGIYARGFTQAAHFQHTDSTSTLDAVLSETSSQGHAAVAAHNNGGGFAFWGASDIQGGIGIYARGAKYAAEFDGAVQVNGTLTATQDVVLGSDCAEDFDVTSLAEVEPGTVMALDDNGALRPSNREYDRKVAGVISGAGDYRPGMILGRCESTHKRLPLALVGKVYCKVDAQYGPVEVGALLTTSPTPGHAMRAADSLKAFGAVIGKALRPLSSGQALVPILVALQ